MTEHSYRFLLLIYNYVCWLVHTKQPSLYQSTAVGGGGTRVCCCCCWCRTTGTWNSCRDCIFVSQLLNHPIVSFIQSCFHFEDTIRKLHLCCLCDRLDIKDGSNRHFFASCHPVAWCWYKFVQQIWLCLPDKRSFAMHANPHSKLVVRNLITSFDVKCACFSSLERFR